VAMQAKDFRNPDALADALLHPQDRAYTVPQLYAWRIKSRIHRRYGELMALERESLSAPSPERRAQLLERLQQIERSVIARRMPGAFADQLYILREHIEFVRDQLTRASG